MIIEPTPTNPRSRLRRAVSSLSVALPLVLLVAVIGAGVLGQAAAPQLPAASPASASASAPSPVRSGRPANADGETVLVGGAPAFPTVADDLAVRTVTEAWTAQGTSTPDQLFAVDGYLAVPRPPTDCVDAVLGPLGPLCERMGILTEQPWSTPGSISFSGGGVHLHARFPVGVRLPDDIARTTVAAGGPPLPVVVVGRFDAAADACLPAGWSCRDQFVVDHVAWTDGAAFPSQPVIDAGVDGNPAEWMLRHQALAEVAAIGWSGTILVAALLQPHTIAQVDPAAAEAVAGGTPPEGLVWYVRGLETGYDPVHYPLGRARPRLTWIVLDDITGTVLARSVPAAQPAP